MKIYKISQKITDFSFENPTTDTEKLEQGERYFGTGHRDDYWSAEIEVNEVKNDSFDIVWAFIDGKIDYRKFKPQDTETHGMIWGHDKTDQTYKGRYEPDTGKLSIVKPERNRMRDVPNLIWRRLNGVFKNIKDVDIF